MSGTASATELLGTNDHCEVWVAQGVYHVWQSADSDTVLFEAEIDREQVYVQGQLLLTLRVQQAVNLDARSIAAIRASGQRKSASH